MCLSQAAWTLWIQGYPDQALDKSAQAVALARKLSHPYSLAAALSFGAMVLQLCRDTAATQEHAEAAILGISNVMHFLRQEVKDNPIFNPLPQAETIDENLGSVCGLANWSDDNGPDTIGYFFLFTKASGSWKLLFLWGSGSL